MTYIDKAYKLSDNYGIILKICTHNITSKCDTYP